MWENLNLKKNGKMNEDLPNNAKRKKIEKLERKKKEEKNINKRNK